jgi:hypothetical protein
MLYESTINHSQATYISTERYLGGPILQYIPSISKSRCGLGIDDIAPFEMSFSKSTQGPMFLDFNLRAKSL